jgi:2-iminobutanoate/2-iminopropanoate deaminase
MSERRNFNTTKAPRMSQVFPQAVIAERLIFLSGTPGFDLGTGQVVSDTFEAQTRQCFQNIKVILEEAGSSTPQVMPFPAGILISVECIALVG